MFSKSLDVDEAFDSLMSCGLVMFVESFEEDISRLSGKLGLPVEARHVRKAPVRASITDHDRAQLREMLLPEYRLCERVRMACGR
jgi:hypothetical protein